MFRRSTKNAFESTDDLYQQEENNLNFNKYKRLDSQDSSLTSHIFDNSRSIVSPIRTLRHDEETNWPKDNPVNFSSKLNTPNLEIVEEIPETTLGEGVSFKGELVFERLLRIDGSFEGSLISNGKIIVGPKGKVKADINLQEAIIEGQVEGNITVKEKVELRGGAIVYGDVKAKNLCVDEGVTIIGHFCISSETTSQSTSETEK